MFPCRDCVAPIPLSGGILGRRASETSPCRRTGNAKRRARPPRGDGEQPGRRRGNRDPRAFFGMAWLLAAPASVSLHSVVGPRQSFLRCPIDGGAIDDGLLRVRWWILRSPAWGPIQPWVGSDVCRSETARSSLRRQSRRSRSSLMPQFGVQLPRPGRRFVMVAPRRCVLYRLFILFRCHACRNFLASNACCLFHR